MALLVKGRFKLEELKRIMRCKAATSDTTWTVVSTPPHSGNRTARTRGNYLDVIPRGSETQRS